MTKSELISRLAAHFPQLVASDAELAVKMILDAMSKSLAQGQRIEIRGFGSFVVKQREARDGRNPRTGKRVAVAAKRVPFFKVGKELRVRVDGESDGDGGGGAEPDTDDAAVTQS
jgi:integration host factor subunit beta